MPAHLTDALVDDLDAAALAAPAPTSELLASLRDALTTDDSQGTATV